MTPSIGEIERTFNEALGANIAGKRKQRRMTQQAITVEIGVHRNAIARWEAGTHPVPLWMLLRIADILSCNHLALLPPRAYTWGSDLALMQHERDPLTRLRYERDPKLTAKELA